MLLSKATVSNLGDIIPVTFDFEEVAAFRHVSPISSWLSFITPGGAYDSLPMKLALSQE